VSAIKEKRVNKSARIYVKQPFFFLAVNKHVTIHDTMLRWCQ